MRSGIMTHGHCDLEASIRLGGAEMHATPLRFLKPMLAGRCPGLYRPLVEDVGGKYLGQPDSDTRWKSAVLHLRKTHASRSRMPAEYGAYHRSVVVWRRNPSHAVVTQVGLCAMLCAMLYA
jgi:hypothetical protein